MGSTRPEGPLLTVAICTHNRSWLLKDALAALTEQTAGTDAFEMLVVDNASTDDTAAVARDFAPRFCSFRYLHEPTLGLSHARNTALRHASAEWVCYLDDDALAAPDYIAVALPLCRNARFSCFGGAILPWRRDPLPAWFLDKYESGSFQDVGCVAPVPRGSFVFGSNMVVKKRSALELGGFDPFYGMRGSTLAFGEETDLQARMKAAGLEIGYAPNLIIRHYARPEKYTVRTQLAIQYKSGLSWQAISHDDSFKALYTIMFKLLASPAKGAWISLRKYAGGVYRWQNVVIETGGRFFFCIGRIAGWRAIRKRPGS